MRVEIAKSTDFAGLCRQALAPFEPHVPWDGRLLLDRLECYRRTGDARRAVAETSFDRYLAANPARLEEGLMPQAPVRVTGE